MPVGSGSVRITLHPWQGPLNFTRMWKASREQTRKDHILISLCPWLQMWPDQLLPTLTSPLVIQISSSSPKLLVVRFYHGNRGEELDRHCIVHRLFPYAFPVSCVSGVTSMFHSGLELLAEAYLYPTHILDLKTLQGWYPWALAGTAIWTEHREPAPHISKEYVRRGLSHRPSLVGSSVFTGLRSTGA